MNILFLETSALVKRYRREPKGTDRVLALTDPSGVMISISPT